MHYTYYMLYIRYIYYYYYVLLDYMLYYTQVLHYHRYTSQRGLCVFGFYLWSLLYTYMLPPDLHCYSLDSNQDYDPEIVWEFVQRHQGYISIQPGGSYRFWIHRDYRSLFVLAFPGLATQHQQDLFL